MLLNSIKVKNGNVLISFCHHFCCKNVAKRIVDFCFPRPEGRGNLKIIEVNKVELMANQIYLVSYFAK
jgi:hypothetical protein